MGKLSLNLGLGVREIAIISPTKKEKILYAKETVYTKTKGHEKVQHVWRKMRNFIWPEYRLQMKKVGIKS